MRGVVPLDEGALHEAILRRSGSGVRGSGSHPDSRKLASAPPGRHYDRSARSSLDEEARVTGKARLTQALPEARSPSLKRRSGAPTGAAPFGAHIRTTEAPRRRSTPLVAGEGKKDEGRPGAQSHRAAERWLAA